MERKSNLLSSGHIYAPWEDGKDNSGSVHQSHIQWSGVLQTLFLKEWRMDGGHAEPKRMPTMDSGEMVDGLEKVVSLVMAGDHLVQSAHFCLPMSEMCESQVDS